MLINYTLLCVMSLVESNNLILTSLFLTVDQALLRLNHYERPKPRECVLRNANHSYNNRIDLIVAGFRYSVDRFKSALRLWVLFSNQQGSNIFPVTNSGIEMFVTNFRVPVTARNYIGSIKNACLILEQPLNWDTPVLRRLIDNVQKLSLNMTVELKSAIQIDLLLKLVNKTRALEASLPLWNQVAMILVLGYSMLLRVPSECMPMVLDKPQTNHSVISVDSNEVKLVLSRRKNLNRPCAIVRSCICSVGLRNITCPVHALLYYVEKSSSRLKTSSALFTINASEFLYRLRILLKLVGVDEVNSFCTKSLRRGGARDIIKADLGVDQIQAAGMWRSREYKTYLDTANIANETMSRVMKRC
jgi:hypothetical protein